MSGKVDKYTRAALDAECTNIRNAPQGARHNTRFAAAAAIGQIVGAEWSTLSAEDAFMELLEAAAANTTLRVDPSSTFTRPGQGDTIAKTIADGLRAGMATPRPRPAELIPSPSTKQTRSTRRPAVVFIPPDSNAVAQVARPTPPHTAPTAGGDYPTAYGGFARVIAVDGGQYTTTTGLVWEWDGRRLVMPAAEVDALRRLIDEAKSESETS